MIPAILIAAGTLAVLSATVSWQVVLLEGQAGLDAHAARGIAWGTALATLLLAVYVSALVFPFRTAVILIVVASLVVAFTVAVYRRASTVASVRRLADDPAGALIGLAWVVGATLFIWPALAWFDYHDSFDVINGHAGISLEIANGTFPPHYLSLPSEQFFYHWGVDVYFAGAEALSGVRIDHAIDGVTLALWLVTLRVAYLVGRALWSARVGAAFAVLLGACGGFPWLFEGISRLWFDRLWFGGIPFSAYRTPQSTQYWLESVFDYRISSTGPPGVAGPIATYGDPPFVSNFFQSPWALGTPLFLAVIPFVGAFFRGGGRSDRVTQGIRVVGLVLLLTALSLAEAALFFVALGALLAVAFSSFWNRRQTSIELASAAVGGVLCSLPISTIAGATLRTAVSRLPGLHTFAPSVRSSGLHLVSLSDAHVISGKIGWNLATFGFLLVGFAVLIRRDVRSTGAGRFVLAVAVLGFAVANVFYYKSGYDIVKFATPAQIVLALGAAATFQPDATRRQFWNRHSLTRLLVCGGICAAGIAYQTSLLLPHTYRTPAIGSKNGLLRTVTPDERRAIDWLRGRVGTGETVVCPIQIDLACAALGGLPQLRIDTSVTTRVYRSSDVAELTRLQNADVMSTSEARAHGVCWLVNSPGRTIPYVGIARLAASSPVVFGAGGVLVFRLC